MEEETQKVVNVTYGSSNEHIYLTNECKMQNLLGKIIKWKRGKSTQKNTRNDEFSAKLFDTIYENNSELAKTFIDGGKATLKTEDEAAKFINY